MSSILGAILALVLAVLAACGQDPGPSVTKPGEADSGERYFGLDVPREWIYEVTFESPRVYYSPYFVSRPGLTATSVTHGFRDPRARALSFPLKALGAYKDRSLAIALDDAGKLFWNASDCGSKLVVVRSGAPLPGDHPWAGRGRDEDREWKRLLPFPAELLALELHLTPCSNQNKPMEDFVWGEILAVVPVDGRSRVSRYGWISAPAAQPVTVPAGTYSRVIYSKFPRGDGQYAPEHVVESWVAADVGLIKYVVTRNDAPVYTLALKSVRKIE